VSGEAGKEGKGKKFVPINQIKGLLVKRGINRSATEGKILKDRKRNEKERKRLIEYI